MAGDPTRWRPETRETADHSIPFVVACALRFGTLEPAHFEDDVLCDPVLLDVRRLTRYRIPDSIGRNSEYVSGSTNLPQGESYGGQQHVGKAATV